MDSWAASRLVKESLQGNEGQKMMSCSRDKVDTQCGRQGRERHSSHGISLIGMVQSMWEFRYKGRIDTYLEAAPPDRGAPVSPSPIRGATAEKERWQRARLAMMAGRVID